VRNSIGPVREKFGKILASGVGMDGKAQDIDSMSYCSIFLQMEISLLTINGILKGWWMLRHLGYILIKILKLKKQILVLITCLLIGCTNSKSRKDHKYTFNLCKSIPGCTCGLYVEGYLSYGMGALGSDVYSEYLTDSSTFRIYIGNYDEYDEKIKYGCSADSVYVEKRTNKGYVRDDWNTYKVLNRKSYSLADLKKRNTLE